MASPAVPEETGAQPVPETQSASQPEPEYVDIDEVGKEAFPFLEGAGEFAGVAFTSLRKTVVKGDVTEVIEVNITGRGRNSREAFENLKDGVLYATKEGYTAWQVRGTVKSAPPVASTPAPVGAVPAPVGSAPAPAGQATQPALPAQTAESGSFHCNKIETAPRPDGRITIKYFSEGLQYAVITQTSALDRAVTLLAPLGGFTAEHLNKVAAYTVSGTVQWVASDKKNTKGNPYKNVVNVLAG